MCTHTSSAHVVRFRHSHWVFTCVRVIHPSNMLNIELLYRIAFCLSVVLYHCFYSKLLKCVKCEWCVYVMFIKKKIVVYLILAYLYTIRELCCYGILVSYRFVVSFLWVYDECVMVLFSLLNQRYMSNTYWYILFNGNGKGWGCGEEII